MNENECLELEQVSPTSNRRRLARTRSRSELDHLYDNLYGSPYYEVSGSCFSPALDVYENGDEFRVSVELPGLDESDVSTTVASGILTIAGEKKMQHEDPDSLCSCSERCYGNFTRTVQVPTSVDLDQINAKFNRGVLEIYMPKKESAKPRSVEIETS